MRRFNRIRNFIHSLGGRLMLMGMLLFGVIVGAMLFNGYNVLREALIKDISVTVKQTSVILNLAVSPYAAGGKLAELDEFAGELLAGDGRYGVVYMAVGRENGPVLLRAGSTTIDLPVPDREDGYSEAISRGVLHIRQPLLLDHNEIGFLQFGLSTELMVAASDSVKQQSIFILVVISVGGAVFIMMLGVYLERRLHGLVSVSAAIAAGDYARRVPVKGHDELSRLAWNFNVMADAVQQRMEEITRFNQTLEKRVTARTFELSELNATLRATIDDLKRTRNSLVRSEKLAGLGSLVAGIAHELNTPIGNALTVASTLLDQTVEFRQQAEAGLRRSALQNYLASAGTAAELLLRSLGRAVDLVTSFKHVAVDQTSEHRRRFELAKVVGEVAATLGPSISKTRYRVELAIPDGVVMDSYPGPIGQIVMNLVNNAMVHAFIGRDHGTFTIAGEVEGGRVVLSFSDDGCGIPPENLSRIYDPFFTTRLGQGGSGLGMSIVHNLVYSVLGGSILVQSELGCGTRFVVELPLVAPVARPGGEG
ncbi:MAG: HAMP domain-containing histidine kinase [Methylococcaceae bacterium]|nr:HAMP domain-containing histidine kinase [Methylococcaceae bacterium]